MKSLLLAAALLALGACAAALRPEAGGGLRPEGRPLTRPLDGPIAPVTRPLLASLGPMRVQSLVDGETRWITIGRYGTGIRAREPGGCSWTRSIDWFAPSDSWAACGTSKTWHTATATVHRSRSLFPMRIGARARYVRNATSSIGKTSRRRTRCKVREAVMVIRPGHPDTPAWEVRCSDKRIVRTTWYAPGKGPIAYREARRGGELRKAWIRID